jgi:hypothetical protein
MLADGLLNPIDTARAQVQEQIGNFLAARARLSRLMNNPSLQIKGQAQGLYAVQTALEDRLQNEITPKLQAIQAGTWSMSDIITLGGFTALIIKQISDVNSLERAGGGPQASFFDINTIGIIGAGALIVLGLGVMSGAFFSGRSQGQV